MQTVSERACRKFYKHILRVQAGVTVSEYSDHVSLAICDTIITLISRYAKRVFYDVSEHSESTLSSMLRDIYVNDFY